MGISNGALMRWEWEGGSPAFVNEWDEAPHAEPVGNDTLGHPRPTTGGRRLRRGANASPSPPEDRPGNDREH
jgi:hypothetical protein